MDIYPLAAPVTVDPMEFEADCSALSDLDPYTILTYNPTDPEPVTPPFFHTADGSIWQVFVDEITCENHLLANLEYNNPDYPNGYWIDYTTAPNATIITRALCPNRTIAFPAPSPNWISQDAASPYNDITITGGVNIHTESVLLGVVEAGHGYYSFENPFCPGNFFEFQAADPHPNKWPYVAWYVRWNLQQIQTWKFSHYTGQGGQKAGIANTVALMLLLGMGFLSMGSASPGRTPRKQ